MNNKLNISLKLIIILITILSFQFDLLNAKVKIFIPDTTVKTGDKFSLQLKGDLEEKNINSIEIKLDFNAYNLDIKSAEGDTNYALKCLNPAYSFDLNNLANSKMDIFCDDIQIINNSIFCTIYLEALSGPDSLTTITIDYIKINGKTIEDAELKPGTIKIIGESIMQNYPEGLGLNFPNPFNDFTKFQISISKSTKVKFQIYSLSGKYLLEDNLKKNMLKLSLVKNKQEIPITSLNEVLSRGNYYLTIQPDGTRFANGEYYLLMSTDQGSYSKKFIYLK